MNCQFILPFTMLCIWLPRYRTHALPYFFLMRIFSECKHGWCSCNFSTPFGRHTGAQLAKNLLVLEQSLESNGRKIGWNFKNLKGKIIFVVMSYYEKEKDSKTTVFPAACTIGQVKGTCWTEPWQQLQQFLIPSSMIEAFLSFYSSETAKWLLSDGRR